MLELFELVVLHTESKVQRTFEVQLQLPKELVLVVLAILTNLTKVVFLGKIVERLSKVHKFLMVRRFERARVLPKQ